MVEGEREGVRWERGQKETWNEWHRNGCKETTPSSSAVAFLSFLQLSVLCPTKGSIGLCGLRRSPFLIVPSGQEFGWEGVPGPCPIRAGKAMRSPHCGAPNALCMSALGLFFAHAVVTSSRSLARGLVSSWDTSFSTHH